VFYVAWASRAIPECPLVEESVARLLIRLLLRTTCQRGAADGAGQPHLYSPLASSHGLPFG